MIEEIVKKSKGKYRQQ